MRPKDFLVLFVIIALGIVTYRVVSPRPDHQAVLPSVGPVPSANESAIHYSSSTVSIDESKISAQKVEETKKEIAKLFPEAALQPPATAVTTSGQIKILPTPTGFLNVRDKPSKSGHIVAKVKPGETYTVIRQQNGWYKIELPSQPEAWVLGTYVSPL